MFLIISLILNLSAGPVSEALDSSTIATACKVLFGIPYLSSFCFQYLWTLISLYRLSLVIQSVCGIDGATCSNRTHITTVLPVISIILALLSACLASLHSEPFLLYRLCQGSCDQYDKSEEMMAAYLTLVPAIILYLPAGVSYGVIFCLVHRARTVQNKVVIKTRKPPIFRIETDTLSTNSCLNTYSTRTWQHKRQSSLNETTTSFVDLEPVKPCQKKLSLPAKLNRQRNSSKVVKTKLAKRNIITAKLSFIVMLFLFLGGIVISITYNKVKVIQVSLIYT